MARTGVEAFRHHTYNRIRTAKIGTRYEVRIVLGARYLKSVRVCACVRCVCVCVLGCILEKLPVPLN